MAAQKSEFHPFTKVDGRYQSVVLAVSYTNQQGKRSFILGRGDPRYHDFSAQCVQNPEHGLPVGDLKFVAGMMEDTPSKTRAWLHAFPTLRKSVGDISRGSNRISPAFADKMVDNALKELGEEMGLTHKNMASWLKTPTISYLHTDADGKEFHGNPLDVHFLSLDLGRLSPAAIKSLHAAIAPWDDTIQSLVICEDELACDTQGRMFGHLHHGVTKTKQSFNGFPEIDGWLAHMRHNTQQETHARVAGIGDAGQHKKALRHGKRFRGHLEAIHTQVRGLEGIDLSSLNTGAPIPVMSSNASIIQELCIKPLKTHDWAHAEHNIAYR